MNRSLPALLLAGCLAFALPAAEAKGPTPTNLDKLNTRADEDDPHLAPDGLHLYYASNAEGNWHVMESARRAATQPWTRGERRTDLNTQKTDDRSAALITSRGQYPHYLYFARKDDLEGSNFDIYMAVKQGARADFTAPTPVNAVCTAADELHPWVTATGRELYFSRKEKDGWRVYVATRPGTGAFGEPKVVDLPPGFHHATLTPDGNGMYLQGPLEGNRWGLFRSKRVAGAWAKPEPVDELNNLEAPTGERSPCLSRDGALLYFVSDRLGGKGGLDLWVVLTAQLAKN